MRTTGQNGTSNSGAKTSKIIIAPHWAAIVALIAIGVLYAFLPSKVNGGPAWLLLTIEAVILLPLLIAILTGHRVSLTTRRIGSLILLGVVTLALSVAIVHLIFTLKKD